MTSIPNSKKTTMPALGSPRTSLTDTDDRACIIVLDGVNQGRILHLKDGENLLGRDENADALFTDEGISRRHALITCDPNGLYYAINDLASSNGTSVNDVPVESVKSLHPGDKIMLGAHNVLRFSMGNEVETRYAAAMYQAVLRDGLTGIFNRRYFDDHLEREVAFTLRYDTPLALLFLDIDHFKSINDNYEHRCGDAVLRQLTAALEQVIRTEDVLARYGGEEFAIICRETTESQACILAERLRRAIQDHLFTFEELALRVTVSIGVAQLDREDLTCGALVSSADIALLKAKETGRNRVVCASYE